MTDNIPERTPRPNPEAAYNPRAFMLMATDAEFFSRRLPRVVRDIAEMDDSMVTVPLLDSMRSVTSGIQTRAPMTFLDVIYGDFARRQGWLVEGQGLMKGLQIAQSMETLSPEQQKAWDTYRFTGNVPREVAVRAFQAGVIHELNKLPSVRYSFDSTAEEFDKQLRRVPFQMAVDFFPDMTDEEARQLFGNTTAKAIRERARDGDQTS